MGVEYEIESNTADDEDEQEESLVQIAPNKLLIAKKTPAKSININNVKKTPTAPTQNKLKPIQPNNKTEMIQEAINILSNVSRTEYVPENDEDEFAQFGKYLIAQLRQLPLVNALQLQEKFQSLLTRERINIMLKSTQPHSGSKSCVQQHQCCAQHQCSSPSTQHQCVQQNQYIPHRMQQHQSIEQKHISESVESQLELNQEGEPKVSTSPINKILYLPNID